MVDTLYMRSSLREPIPQKYQHGIVIGPMHLKSRCGIQHTLDYLFCRPKKPSPQIQSFLNIAISVFAVDKLVSRADQSDSWTRELELSVPTSSSWTGLEWSLQKTLEFLTGDIWTLSFRDAAPRVRARRYWEDKFVPDVVSLFSGGIDSLAGAITLLEQKKRVLLVGHHDFGFIAGRQSELAKDVQREYGSEQVRFAQYQLQVPNAREQSTRARSILFIALGLAVASSFGEIIPLFIPENGFVGINTPLTPSRIGSYSTRTTHPLFFDWLSETLRKAGIVHELVNPFRFLTKGDIFQQSPNKEFLQSAVSKTISCAHSVAARWVKKAPENCGYCIPCLIRRASLNVVEQDDPDDYTYDAIGDDAILNYEHKGKDLRSLLISIRRSVTSQKSWFLEVLKTGSLGSLSSEAKALVDVYTKGLKEVERLIKEKACAAVRNYAGL
ncbi:MAG: hypothetical protein HWN66_12600 [Candidatus Helarchaeota archaeon]|nr:hypothetical protein [Candidatus Helarchaeota archaeon]